MGSSGSTRQADGPCSIPPSELTMRLRREITDDNVTVRIVPAHAVHRRQRAPHRGHYWPNGGGEIVVRTGWV